MQIYQCSCAEQTINLVFTRCIHTASALERAWLVRSEVIYVASASSPRASARFRPPATRRLSSPLRGSKPSFFIDQLARCVPKRQSNKYWQSRFSYEWSPSRSRKTSSAEGSGNLQNPLPAATGNNGSCTGLFSKRAATCTRACSRTHSMPSREPCCGLS